ncbi:MAG TPA: VOC family protein [Pyrinomonadaceae bacterium]|jgi:catechol 2,3-dioxygenase-like lactoylglutathione lyase family enzyme
MIKQLHHVNVTVPPDLEAATKTFYGAVLGLEELPKPLGTRKSGAWYQIGPVQLHLSIEDGADGSLSSRHICFAVVDLGAAERRLQDARVEIIADDRPIPGVPRFYVRDPGGNRIEIVEQRETIESTHAG